jgi:hypothetical protein
MPGQGLLYVPAVTIDPGTPTASASSRLLADTAADGRPTAGPPGTPGPRRGYRARPAAEVAALISALAHQIADEARHVLAVPTSTDIGQQSTRPETVTLVTVPMAGWYPVLAAAVPDTVPRPHVPVRGITDVVTAAAAVPPALDAIGTIAHGFARWMPGLSPSGRSPLLTEADIGGLWLDSLVQALRQQLPRRTIRAAGIGPPQLGSADGCYLISAAVSATLAWRPRRRLRKSRDWALANWLIVDTDGHLIGGGVTHSWPTASVVPQAWHT